MFAQSVDENIGQKVVDGIAAPGEATKVVIIFFGLLIGFMAAFILIMYFVRRKTMTKAERKPKVLRLP